MGKLGRAACRACLGSVTLRFIIALALLGRSEHAAVPVWIRLELCHIFCRGFATNKTAVKTADAVEATATVTNRAAGDEVVQLYIHQRAGSTSRPLRELQGCEGIARRSEESKTMTLHAWEKGTYLPERKLQSLGGRAGAVRCVGRRRLLPATACRFPRGGIETQSTIAVCWVFALLWA